MGRTYARFRLARKYWLGRVAAEKKQSDCPTPNRTPCKSVRVMSGCARKSQRTCVTINPATLCVQLPARIGPSPVISAPVNATRRGPYVATNRDTGIAIMASMAACVLPMYDSVELGAKPASNRASWKTPLQAS